MYLPFSDPLHLVVRTSLRRTAVSSRVKRHFYTGIPAFPMWVYAFSDVELPAGLDVATLLARLGGVEHFRRHELLSRASAQWIALDLLAAPLAPSAFIGLSGRRPYLSVNFVATAVNGPPFWDAFALDLDRRLRRAAKKAPVAAAPAQ